MTVAAQIQMLNRQREKIDEKDFDLEAWKSTTATLITNIFGDQDHRLQTIENLKIDYGSWALRDASSKYDPVATCKRKARDLVELTVAELESMEQKGTSDLFEVLGDHLTGAQLKEIKAMASKKDKKKAKADLLKKMQALKAPLLSKILVDLLVGEGNKKK